MQVFLATRSGAVYLLAAGFYLLSVPVMADCNMVAMEYQMEKTELRVDDARYAESGYRKRLLRFVNDYYSDVAEDLLRGDGEYLRALHVLMGSVSDGCTAEYRRLLVQEVNSQDFGLALWTMRVSKTAQALGVQTSDVKTWAAQSWNEPVVEVGDSGKK